MNALHTCANVTAREGQFANMFIHVRHMQNVT